MACSNADTGAAPGPGCHKPVLLHEVINALVPGPGLVYCDFTLGAGGHFLEVARHLGPGGTAIGLDWDQTAVRNAEVRFHDGIQGVEIHLVQTAFEYARRVLDRLGLNEANLVLADLGYSSDQLEDPGRGLSFLKEGPLDMQLSSQGSLSAAEVVNDYPADKLLAVLEEYGEERYSRRIVESIVSRRRKAPLQTTSELAELISSVVPATKRIHPATRTFQAIRIEVNDELGQIRRGLSAACELLAIGGRLAVITFHGLEERVVKQTLRPFGRHGDRTDWQVNPLGKVVYPSTEEIKANPRSRSAKLRTYLKTALVS